LGPLVRARKQMEGETESEVLELNRSDFSVDEG
jgi:hypothetical protein